MSILKLIRKIFHQKKLNEGSASASRRRDGFTIVELMVALSVFIIVMTISMGSILSVFDANRKSRNLRTVIGNLNLAVESMSKEMRYGRNYHCSSTTSPGTLTATQNCAGGGPLMSFLSTDNAQVTYRFNGPRIEKSIGAGAYTALTAPEVIIDDLTFYTTGTVAGDGSQPKTIMIIRSHAGTGKGRSDFIIQTLVSQRRLDI